MSLTALNQGVGKAALLLGAPEKTLSLPLFHFLGASHIPWLMASSPSRQTSKPVIYQLSPPPSLHLPLTTAWKSSLLLRIHVIRLGLPG